MILSGNMVRWDGDCDRKKIPQPKGLEEYHQGASTGKLFQGGLLGIRKKRDNVGWAPPTSCPERRFMEKTGCTSEKSDTRNDLLLLYAQAGPIASLMAAESAVSTFTRRSH
ncbi:MAG: hypothetical protein EBE86_030985 [Hormoscilla sp. GUM202]|nr:hypothetical protein [Hormoscilla sp. GUM202]